MKKTKMIVKALFLLLLGVLSVDLALARGTRKRASVSTGATNTTTTSGGAYTAGGSSLLTEAQDCLTKTITCIKGVCKNSYCPENNDAAVKALMDQSKGFNASCADAVSSSCQLNLALNIITARNIIKNEVGADKTAINFILKQKQQQNQRILNEQEEANKKAAEDKKKRQSRYSSIAGSKKAVEQPKEPEQRVVISPKTDEGVKVVEAEVVPALEIKEEKTEIVKAEEIKEEKKEDSNVVLASVDKEDDSCPPGFDKITPVETNEIRRLDPPFYNPLFQRVVYPSSGFAKINYYAKNAGGLPPQNSDCCKIKSKNIAINEQVAYSGVQCLKSFVDEGKKATIGLCENIPEYIQHSYYTQNVSKGAEGISTHTEGVRSFVAADGSIKTFAFKTSVTDEEKQYYTEFEFDSNNFIGHERNGARKALTVYYFDLTDKMANHADSPFVIAKDTCEDIYADVKKVVKEDNFAELAGKPYLKYCPSTGIATYGNCITNRADYTYQTMDTALKQRILSNVNALHCPTGMPSDMNEIKQYIVEIGGPDAAALT